MDLKVNTTQCPLCGCSFEFDKEQIAQIKDAATAGIRRLVLTCPNCHNINFVYPLVITGISDHIPEIPKDNRVCQCPIEACIGVVEKNEEKKGAYGCPECGNEWSSKEALFKSIREIVEKYPYRKEVYIFHKNNIKSIPFKMISSKYYSKVQEEEI